MSEPTCAELIEGKLQGRLEDFKALWELEYQGEEEHNELGTLNEYGLSLDYVLLEGNRRGYWRWQLSRGGPSDEFRFYGECVGEYQGIIDRVVYNYADWFDGALQELDGDDLQLMQEIFVLFIVEAGTAAHLHSEALKKLEAHRDFIDCCLFD